MNNKAKPKAGKDPFELFALRMAFDFRFEPDDWSFVENFAIEHGLPEVNTIMLPMRPATARVGGLPVRTAQLVSHDPSRLSIEMVEALPLKTAIEVEISSFQAHRKFHTEYRSATRKQILKALTAAEKRARMALAALQSPIPCDYGGLDPSISLSLRTGLRVCLEGLRPRLIALRRGEALPGRRAPSDGPTAGLQQSQHQYLSRDPKQKIVLRMRDIFEEAFGRPAATTDDSLTAEFIVLVLRPVIPDINSVRRILKKPRS
jgi:hypothetical protein